MRFVRPEEAFEVVRWFVELYHDHGGRQNRQKHRARFFVDERGGGPCVGRRLS